MKEQFAVDEQRWRKWWGEKKAFWLSTKPLIMLLKAKGAFQYAILSGELSPLPLWQHLLALPIRFIFKIWIYFLRQWTSGKHYFIPISSLIGGYALILVWLYYTFESRFEKLASLTIKNWDDLRSIGFLVASLIAIPAGAIGYFLSARRTQAMQEDNRLKLQQQDREEFSRALELIDKSDSATVGAIRTLTNLGLTRADYQSTSLSLLVSYLESKAKKGNEGIRPDGDKFLNQIQQAFLGVCDLNDKSQANGEMHSIQQLELVNLDLSKINFGGGLKITSILFRDCKFFGINSIGTIICQSNFLNCNFENASFLNCNFLMGKHGFEMSIKGSKLENCSISGTDFSGVTFFDANQFLHCRYFSSMPPKGLPSRVFNDIDQMTLDAGECGMEFEMNLPTPYLYAIYGEPAQNPRHSTRVEAETFWSADGNEKYRPRDREGNLIEIVYPDESEDLSDDDCPPSPHRE